MMTRFVRGALAAACGVTLMVAFVMPAGEAMAFSEPIPTKISLLKWGGNPLVGKLYKIVSKAPNPPLFALPTPGPGDPVALGGSVEVRVAQGAAGRLLCDLPPGAFDGNRGWKALGNPAGSKGYKYINKGAPQNDPCKIAIIKQKVIKVLAKSVGTIDPPVDAPPGNGDVSLALTVGSDEYCALAAAPHFKEKAGSLIKMKDEPAPSDCTRCGDNAVNQPSEECDGSDDALCEGLCQIDCVCPPPVCGNNVAEVGEECDGADAPTCSGICQNNCRCPEPLCGNGVLEAGEDCEPPCSEDPPCGGGTICGADCTCVPNIPCDCGAPDPGFFDFTTMTGTGVCGEVRDGSDVKLTDLDCAKSYLGGGILGSFAIKGTGIPLGTNIHRVECCYGTTMVLGATTEAETGDRKTCTSAGCALGGPVPTITTPAIISVCSVNTLEFDSFGYMDCSTGEGFISIPMFSGTYLIGDGMPRRCSPDTTGGAAGFRCTDDSDCPGGTCLWDYAQHCDSSSPNAGAYCTSDGQCAPGTCLGDEYWQPCPICNPVTLRCNGGQDQGNACTPQTPDLGPAYPNSQDCLPPSANLVATTHMPNPLGTATASMEAADGQFCGYCRDVDVEGSLCFEGDSDEFPAPGGKQGCPDSLVIADCKPATYHSDPPVGGDLDDIAGCGPLAMTRCNSDADCYAPYESCVQRDLGAFDEAGGRSIMMSGTGAGDLRDGLEHPALLAGVFCTPASFSDADSNASLPGPGASSYPAMFHLSP